MRLLISGIQRMFFFLATEQSEDNPTKDSWYVPSETSIQGFMGQDVAS